MKNIESARKQRSFHVLKFFRLNVILKKFASSSHRFDVRHSLSINFTKPVPVAAQSTAQGLPPLDCCNCGFESRRGHGCTSLVIVVCCQVEVSGVSRSLVQSSPTECGVSECDGEASIIIGPGPLGDVRP